MVFLYFFPRTKLNRNCSQAVGKVQSLLCGTQTQNMLTLLLLGWALTTLLRHLFYSCLLLPCRNWISCAVFAPGVVARVIWAVSHRVDTGTTWWTPLTAFILGTLTWVACHVANEEHALLNYHVGPVPSIEAFTKDFLLVAAPLLKLRHCRVFFPVTTSQVYGRTGDKEEAQSCIPLFSSCLPLKSSSEDKTPFLTAPLQKHKGKQNKTEKVLLLFFVWIWVSVREGGDPASGRPPVLVLCLPTIHW